MKSDWRNKWKIEILITSQIFIFIKAISRQSILCADPILLSIWLILPKDLYMNMLLNV